MAEVDTLVSGRCFAKAPKSAAQGDLDAYAEQASAIELYQLQYPPVS
jgi:hypothetical protein